MQWIELPCQPHDSLDWTLPLEQADLLMQRGERIIWRCNLGIESPFYPLDDEMRFQSATLAMSQFSKLVWPKYQEFTEFVCLYRGTADFESSFSWTPRQLTDFEQFADIDDPMAKHLFAAESFAIYFQMLSHRLPDEAKVLLLLDLSSISSPGAALRILAKERFDHFTLALRGKDLPIEGYRWDQGDLTYRKIAAKAGLVIPQASCHDLDSLLHVQGGKIVFETFLSEEWEGLDQLYVIENSLSAQALRKLSGFRAAGGEVIEIVKSGDSG